MTDISNFKNFYVVEGRHSGLDQTEIRDYAPNTPKRIAFPEDSYTAGLDANPTYDVTKLRSEEHTSELPSLMRTSYPVLCLQNTTHRPPPHQQTTNPTAIQYTTNYRTRHT